MPIRHTDNRHRTGESEPISELSATIELLVSGQEKATLAENLQDLDSIGLWFGGSADFDVQVVGLESANSAGIAAALNLS
jgi:hypothetical protein